MNDAEARELVRQTTEVVQDDCSFCHDPIPEEHFYYYREFDRGGETVEAQDFCSRLCLGRWLAIHRRVI